MPVLRNWTSSEPTSLSDNVSELPDTCHLRTNMARPLLKMQRRQARGQSIRWKRGLRHLAAREVSTALQEQRREYRARSQAHEIRSALESFLFWLSFVLFRVVRIMSAAALVERHRILSTAKFNKLFISIYTFIVCND